LRRSLAAALKVPVALAGSAEREERNGGDAHADDRQCEQ
jgi:hypothetical protein